MSRRPADQPRSALLRALEPHAAPCTLLSATSRDWASTLFVGARHRLTIAIEGDDAPVRADGLGRELGEIDLRCAAASSPTSRCWHSSTVAFRCSQSKR
ncbi:MAG TPA: hypothetical protein VKQ09_05620 [Sphingomonas sp.]|nr:hypothetical protein [Sphingomonas sp.]